MTAITRMFDYDRLADESWARLQAASDDPAHPMHLAVLANAVAGGAADARTMVLRGADRRSGRIWFYTDRRTEKVDQLRGRAEVCVVAYDRTCGIQLRLRGSASVLESGPAAEVHWRQASLAVRALFASPDPPGSPLRQPDPRLVGIKRSLDTGREVDARSNFAVIEVTLLAIEWLQIIDDEQRRAVLHRATGWAAQPLAP